MCGNACRVFGEAWHKVKGMKKSFWGGAVLTVLIGLGGFLLLTSLLLFAQTLYFPGFFEVIRQNTFFFLESKFVMPVGLLVLLLLYHLSHALFEMFVMLPMRIGILLISMRQVSSKSISALYVFTFFRWEYIWRFAVLEAIIILIVAVPAGIGITLFCIPGILGAGIVIKSWCYLLGSLLLLLAIYLAVAYLFSYLLIIDRKMGPWEAMEASRKAITKRWFCVLGALIWVWIVISIGALLLLVGLIWAVPYAQNIVVVLYRDLMGIEGKDPVSLVESR